MSWIDPAFPASLGQYAITSPTDDRYNCIAWAAGDTSVWWSHLPGYKWPAVRSPLIDALVAVFAAQGFERCDSGDVEVEYDKVVLYSKQGLWTHASRQLPNGSWTSKLGPDEDVEHRTPEALCGDNYGQIHCFMRKRRVTAPAQGSNSSTETAPD